MPAKPYSFVGGHHVPEPIGAFGAVDVVLQGLQSLIPSPGGTTSLSPSVRPHLRIGFNMFPAAGYRNCRNAALPKETFQSSKFPLILQFLLGSIKINKFVR